MGLHKGQKPKGHGVKGKSGRKSAYAERIDADRLINLVSQRYTKGAIKKKLNKDEMDFLERRVLKAHLGDQIIAAKIIDKLFPDHLKLDDMEVKHYFKLD